MEQRTGAQQKIKAAIFDIDGTLADTVPLIIAAFHKAIEPIVQRPLSDEEIQDSFGPDEEGSVRSFVPNDTVKGTDDFIAEYKALHPMCSEPFAGIPDLLGFLKQKGVRIAVATAKRRDTTDFTLDYFKLGSTFENIETGSPEGSRKVEAIASILKSFNISAADAIYVGDSPSDISESKEAGVTAVAAAWASTVKVDKLMAEEPDILFHSVDEFAGWLRERV